jgi:hypothetical protein
MWDFVIGILSIVFGAILLFCWIIRVETWKTMISDEEWTSSLLLGWLGCMFLATGVVILTIDLISSMVFLR